MYRNITCYIMKVQFLMCYLQKKKKNPTHGIWEEPRLGKTAIGFQKPSKLHTLGF